MALVPWWFVFFYATGCHSRIYNHGSSWAGYDFHTYPHPAKKAIIPLETMVDVINNLGLKLLAIHNEYNENNIAISPYGALSVLVALGEGLEGDAAYEIKQAAHLPNDISTIRVGLRDIHRHLKSYFIPKEGFLAGLTLNHENVTLRPEYEDILRFYGYDIVSFNNALFPPPETTQKPETITKRITPIDQPTDVSPTTESTNEETTETTTVVTTEPSTTTARITTQTETERPVTTTLETTTYKTTTEKTATTLDLSTISTLPQNTMTTEVTTVEPKTVEVTSMSVPSTTNEVISTTQQMTSTSPTTTESIATTTDISLVTVTTQETPRTTRGVTTTESITATTGTVQTVSTTITEDTTTEITTQSHLTSTVETTTNLPSSTTLVETTQNVPTTLLPTISTSAPEDLTTLPTSTTVTDTTDDSPIIEPISSTLPSTTTSKVFTETTEITTTETSETSSTDSTINEIATEVPIEEIGFAGAKRNARAGETSNFNNVVELNMKEQMYGGSKRSSRSVVDYVIARYYDDHYILQHRRQRPYIPKEELSFLIYGKYREYNINFMKYDTVLPFYYVPHLDTLALSFPLDSTKYYLLLLLPVDETGIDKLVCDLRLNGSLKYIIANLRYTHVIATIPSFMLKGYVTLTPTFQKLGIRKVFEPRQADFSPMTNQSQVYVTNIEQAITVTIRNYVDPETMHNYRNLHQYSPVHFKADHPFLYFVIDTELHVTLMAGKIVNPLNSRIS